MRKGVALIAGLVILLVVNGVIWQRERLLAQGQVVRLEIAPLDPRSLLQGDYMALQFRVAADALAAPAVSGSHDGHLVLALDPRAIARFVRRDDGAPLAAGEVRLRYRLRDGRVRLATNAWFFEEGRAEHFSAARYGELRVGDDGEALLARVLDAKLQPIDAQAR